MTHFPRIRAVGRGSGQSGFTLLELTLVVVILAIFVGIAIPRMRDPGRQDMLSEARKLTVVFRLLRSEAVIQEAEYRLNYDMDADRYWISSEDSQGTENGLVTGLGSLAKNNQLPRRVELSDVAFPDFDAKVSQGQAYTTFYPDGTVDKTVIHLKTAREATTLHLNPMSNRLETTAGYHDIRYN